MSLPITLQNVFAAAPTVTSLSNLSMLCVNSSGELQKNATAFPAPNTPSCTDANSAPPGFSRTLDQTVNLPKNGLGGFLLTLQYDQVAASQMFFCWEVSALLEIFTRKRRSTPTDKSWTPWHQMAFES